MDRLGVACSVGGGGRVRLHRVAERPIRFFPPLSSSLLTPTQLRLSNCSHPVGAAAGVHAGGGGGLPFPPARAGVPLARRGGGAGRGREGAAVPLALRLGRRPSGRREGEGEQGGEDAGGRAPSRLQGWRGPPGCSRAGGPARAAAGPRPRGAARPRGRATGARRGDALGVVGRDGHALLAVLQDLGPVVAVHPAPRGRTLSLFSGSGDSETFVLGTDLGTGPVPRR